MKYTLAFLVTNILATEAFLNLWQLQQPTKQQVSQAKKRSQEKKPAPVIPPPSPEEQKFQMPEVPSIPDDINPISPGAWNAMTSAALGFASKFAPKDVRKQASDRAARISVNRLPPTSFQVDLNDVPIVGKALSGTYAKVKEIKGTPSFVIASPKDKLGALSEAAEMGQLEFGLNGLLRSSLDIQLEPNRPGIAPVQIKSPLIPKWPFGRTKSDWYRVQNLGDGETYYFNSKTGETQIDEPNNI